MQSVQSWRKSWWRDRPGCTVCESSGSHAQTPASRARSSSSGMGHGDSEASRQGGQLQGQGETGPGFSRSSPERACEGRETQCRTDGRHAHRRTRIEVVVGGQKLGDARCSRRGGCRGDLFVGAIDCEGRQAVGSVLPTGNFRRRIPISISCWRGSIRTLLKLVRTRRCLVAKYGHRGTRF